MELILKRVLHECMFTRGEYYIKKAKIIMNADCRVKQIYGSWRVWFSQPSAVSPAVEDLTSALAVVSVCLCSRSHLSHCCSIAGVEPQSWCLYSEPWAETERMRHLNASLLCPVSCISLYSHTDCLLDMYIKVYSRALTIKIIFRDKGNRSDAEWKPWHIICLYSYSLFVVHFFFNDIGCCNVRRL